MLTRLCSCTQGSSSPVVHLRRSLKRPGTAWLRLDHGNLRWRVCTASSRGKQWRGNGKTRHIAHKEVALDVGGGRRNDRLVVRNHRSSLSSHLAENLSAACRSDLLLFSTADVDALFRLSLS